MKRKRCNAYECWNCGEPQFDNKERGMLYKKLTEIARTSREFQMATQASFTDVINQIDGATNVIAAILEDLKKKIAGGGLDAATEDAVLTQLQASADKLKSMGSPPVVV